MAKYKISEENLLVIYDDYDLPKGSVRVRPSGSAGTHNGMRNIIQNIGTTEFPRVRIGIHDEEWASVPIIDYVLARIREKDDPVYDEALQLAGKAGALFAEGAPFDAVMRECNKR